MLTIIRQLFNLQLRMDSRKVARELRGLKGRLVLMQEENKRYYEQKDKEYRELTEDVDSILKSIENGGNQPGTGLSLLTANFSATSRTPTKRTFSSANSDENSSVNNGVAPPPKREKSDLKVDSDGYTIVHTDGACSDNGRSNAKAGVGIFWGDDCEHNHGGPVQGDRHTNNVAEIQAATFAISIARGLGIRKLNIHTDSQFLINCMTRWIAGWKKNNWRTASKQPVINKEDLQSLELEMKKGSVDVKWTHVKGHQGIHGNEEADRLARQGAEMN
eukprot:TRINITY_DN1376_c0_g1_i11.p1 TRINITY_DN1376_c0_g1~~TRINITY_DN1376_c0_g1_i11.p1  ORF type:complete len:275 (-),score=45.63 TRINITY_DN1376_c0_g1_i11:593-1417(-)